jgi:hypothetical protein
MLFLGAGASAPFGVPTMQGLTELCENYLRENGFAELEAIRESMKRFGLVSDFESLLSVLQGLASPVEMVKVSGPFTAYLANHIQDFDVIKQTKAAEYVEALKKILVEKCKEANITTALDAYTALFEMMARVQTINLGPFQTQWQGGAMVQQSGRPPRKTQDIFTTNYDLIVENCFRLGKFGELRTGFKTINMQYLWSPDDSYGFGQNVTNLVKLHGSIDQFLTSDGIEKRQAPPTEGFYLTKALEEMMIYPVHEKYVTRSPYFELMSIFRRQFKQEPVCVVIGYSFRDEAINNAFVDGMTMNPNLKLIYVGGNHAEDNLQNLLKTSPAKLGDGISKRTKAITLRFGEDPQLWEELKTALEKWSPAD